MVSHRKSRSGRRNRTGGRNINNTHNKEILKNKQCSNEDILKKYSSILGSKIPVVVLHKIINTKQSSQQQPATEKINNSDASSSCVIEDGTKNNNCSRLNLADNFSIDLVDQNNSAKVHISESVKNENKLGTQHEKRTIEIKELQKHTTNLEFNKEHVNEKNCIQNTCNDSSCSVTASSLKVKVCAGKLVDRNQVAYINEHGEQHPNNFRNVGTENESFETRKQLEKASNLNNVIHLNDVDKKVKDSSILEAPKYIFKNFLEESLVVDKVKESEKRRNERRTHQFNQCQQQPLDSPFLFKTLKPSLFKTSVKPHDGEVSKLKQRNQISESSIKNTFADKRLLDKSDIPSKISRNVVNEFCDNKDKPKIGCAEESNLKEQKAERSSLNSKVSKHSLNTSVDSVLGKGKYKYEQKKNIIKVRVNLKHKVESSTPPKESKHVFGSTEHTSRLSTLPTYCDTVLSQENVEMESKKESVKSFVSLNQRDSDNETVLLNNTKSSDKDPKFGICNFTHNRTVLDMSDVDTKVRPKVNSRFSRSRQMEDGETVDQCTSASDKERISNDGLDKELRLVQSKALKPDKSNTLEPLSRENPLRANTDEKDYDTENIDEDVLEITSNSVFLDMNLSSEDSNNNEDSADSTIKIIDQFLGGSYSEEDTLNNNNTNKPAVENKNDLNLGDNSDSKDFVDNKIRVAKSSVCSTLINENKVACVEDILKSLEKDLEDKITAEQNKLTIVSKSFNNVAKSHPRNSVQNRNDDLKCSFENLQENKLKTSTASSELTIDNLNKFNSTYGNHEFSILTSTNGGVNGINTGNVSEKVNEVTRSQDASVSTEKTNSISSSQKRKRIQMKEIEPNSKKVKLNRNHWLTTSDKNKSPKISPADTSNGSLKSYSAHSESSSNERAKDVSSVGKFKHSNMGAQFHLTKSVLVDPNSSGLNVKKTEIGVINDTNMKIQDQEMKHITIDDKLLNTNKMSKTSLANPSAVNSKDSNPQKTLSAINKNGCCKSLMHDKLAKEHSNATAATSSTKFRTSKLSNLSNTVNLVNSESLETINKLNKTHNLSATFNVSDIKLPATPTSIQYSNSSVQSDMTSKDSCNFSETISRIHKISISQSEIINKTCFNPVAVANVVDKMDFEVMLSTNTTRRKDSCRSKSTNDDTDVMLVTNIVKEQNSCRTKSDDDTEVLSVTSSISEKHFNLSKATGDATDVISTTYSISGKYSNLSKVSDDGTTVMSPKSIISEKDLNPSKAVKDAPDVMSTKSITSEKDLKLSNANNDKPGRKSASPVACGTVNKKRLISPINIGADDCVKVNKELPSPAVQVSTDNTTFRKPFSKVDVSKEKSDVSIKRSTGKKVVIETTVPSVKLNVAEKPFCVPQKKTNTATNVTTDQAEDSDEDDTISLFAGSEFDFLSNVPEPVQKNKDEPESNSLTSNIYNNRVINNFMKSTKREFEKDMESYAEKNLDSYDTLFENKRNHPNANVKPTVPVLHEANQHTSVKIVPSTSSIDDSCTSLRQRLNISATSSEASEAISNYRQPTSARCSGRSSVFNRLGKNSLNPENANSNTVALKIQDTFPTCPANVEALSCNREGIRPEIDDSHMVLKDLLRGTCWTYLKRKRCMKLNCTHNHDVNMALSKLIYLGEEKIMSLLSVIYQYFTFFYARMYPFLTKHFQPANIIKAYWHYYERNYMPSFYFECTILELEKKTMKLETIVEMFMRRVAVDPAMPEKIIHFLIKRIPEGQIWETLKDAFRHLQHPPREWAQVVINECINTKKSSEHCVDVFNNLIAKLTQRDLENIGYHSSNFHNLLKNKSQSLVGKWLTENSFRPNCDEDGIASPIQEENDPCEILSLFQSATSQIQERNPTTQNVPAQFRQNSTQIGNHRRQINEGTRPLDGPEYRVQTVDAPYPSSIFRGKFSDLQKDIQSLRDRLRHKDYKAVTNLLAKYVNKPNRTAFDRTCYHYLEKEKIRCQVLLSNIITHAVRMGVIVRLHNTLFRLGMGLLTSLADSGSWVLAHKLLYTIEAHFPRDSASFVLLSAQIYLANRRQLKALSILKSRKMLRTDRKHWMVGSTKDDEFLRGKTVISVTYTRR
ncbi:putative uncharacterized protein DDB_G0282133 isoform X2 [Orussus abietinus]|uniref:putative uncharacterized protein DDB_G0282133 isoform X2 n=1 Tax=Orussus abietinus TaxID=222816 RepID=UPI000626A89F|nr:putative uncharacterized protein DDB_G0282133 isoform X2 [Orussus abietinus]